MGDGWDLTLKKTPFNCLPAVAFPTEGDVCGVKAVSQSPKHRQHHQCKHFQAQAETSGPHRSVRPLTEVEDRGWAMVQNGLDLFKLPCSIGTLSS